MLDHSTLKLVNPAKEEGGSDVLPFERRRATRHVLSGRVTAVRTEYSAEAHRNRICPLQLSNISDTGLGAIAQEPLEINTSIVVFFPPHGPEKGFDAYGHVVRCTPREQGHEVGIRLDVRPAA